MMQNDRHIRLFQQKLLICLTLRRFVFFATVYLFLWGTFTLILRASLGIPLHQILWAGLGLIPVFITAFFMEKHRLPGHSAVSALLDQYNQMNGLLMAADETDASLWMGQNSQIRSPSVFWHGKREWSLLAMALVFLYAAAFTPRYIKSLQPGSSLDIGETADKLAAGIDILEEENILEKSEAQKIKEELEKLSSTAEGKDPAKTWESLDHLEENLRAEAQKAAQDMSDNLSSFARMESLAEALSGESGLKPDVRSEIMKQMGRELSEMLSSGENAGGDSAAQVLSTDMLEALGKGELSNAEMEKLKTGMQEMKEQISGKLERMEKAGLAQSMPGKSPSEGQADTSELAAFLKENAENLSAEDVMNFMPGKGGTDRGRADAVMTWKEMSPEATAGFKEETIPLSEVSAAQENLLMGISQGKPEPNADAVPVSPGMLSDTPAGAGSAIIRRTLPRHKEAVRRYFDPQEKGQDGEKFIFDEVWSGWG
ncbi:MAG: hypothetical protein AB7S75_21020 [Desulfococcaceae bacterium]